jgi:hypothetical protein
MLSDELMGLARSLKRSVSKPGQLPFSNYKKNDEQRSEVTTQQTKKTDIGDEDEALLPLVSPARKDGARPTRREARKAGPTSVPSREQKRAQVEKADSRHRVAKKTEVQHPAPLPAAGKHKQRSPDRESKTTSSTDRESKKTSSTHHQRPSKVSEWVSVSKREREREPGRHEKKHEKGVAHKPTRESEKGTERKHERAHRKDEEAAFFEVKDVSHESHSAKVEERERRHPERVVRRAVRGAKKEKRQAAKHGGGSQ